MAKFLNTALPLAVLLLLIGCAGSGERDVCDGVTLIQERPDALELQFCKRYFAGIFGSHGYSGYKYHAYAAALLGRGPTFENPLFQDDPPDFQCVGNITLDEGKNRVTINMRRIVSRPGEPERTEPHPANGTYPINSKRVAKEDEQRWFDNWVNKPKN